MMVSLIISMLEACADHSASPDSVPAASLKDSGSYLQYIDQIFPLENQNKAKLIPRAKDGKKGKTTCCPFIGFVDAN